MNFSVYTGAAGDPSSATIVTPDEESKYVHDVQQAASDLLAKVDPRYREGLFQVLGEIAKGDAFWSQTNQDRRLTVTEYESWKMDLDAHVQQWDSRSIIDKAGRFIVVGVIGSFVVNDWANQTAAFDAQLRDWARRFVAEGILTSDQVPSDEINRPQSILSGGSAGGGGLLGGAYGIGNSVIKPLATVAIIAGVVWAGVTFIPPWLEMRAARKVRGET